MDGSVLLAAMGQAFFSLSVGMGCLCTYASYFKPDTNLSKTAFSVAVIDTCVAILAGFIIFPAAFAVGIQPDSGPGLLFVTLPNVFQQAFGNVPFIAALLAVMFYILLALAALTSTISLHEVVTAYLHEEFNMSRAKAARLVTGGCIVLGTLCSLSLGIGSDYTLFGMTLFDFGRILHLAVHGLVLGQEDCPRGTDQPRHAASAHLRPDCLPAEVRGTHRHRLYLY